MKIPFYKNLKDNTHCFQAVLKMVLKYFEPDKDYSWKMLEEITAKKPGLWTWDYAAMMWLAQNNHQVVSMTGFNAKKFVKNPRGYLFKYYGKKAGAEQIKHCDIKHEQRIAKKILNFDKKLFIHQIPKLKDMINYLNKDFLLMVSLNADSLDNKKGYSAHMVLVYRITGCSVIFHDPGLPGRPARRKSLKNFYKAWAYPKKDNTNFIAVKKNN